MVSALSIEIEFIDSSCGTW